MIPYIPKPPLNK